MNGIHDMGGMQGMGPLQHEKNEPVYHAEWEKRIDAMDQSMRLTGKIGGSRRGIEENILAADYLRMSYYERWYVALVERLIANKLVTRAEVESGQPAERGLVRAATATEAVSFVRANFSTRQNVELAHGFKSARRCARVI